MFKKLLFLPIGALLTLQVFAQANQTATYQPDATEGIDASIGNRNDSHAYNYGTLTQLNAFGWTSSLTGSPDQDWRFLIKFTALDALKDQNATINSAKIILTTINPDNLGLGENAAKLFSVNQAWDESTVTWDNQPTSDATPFITIPKILSNVKTVEIDITSFAKNIVENGTINYGFIYKLDSEDPYRCIQFASSDYATASMRPKLVVNYDLPTTSLALSATKRISFYPNPASNEIVLDPNMKFNKISIIDAQGNEALTGLNSENKINISGLKEGVYILLVSTDSDLYSEKFIVKK